MLATATWWREVPESVQLPFSRWLGDGIAWLFDTFDAALDVLQDVLRVLTVNTEQLLLWSPWVLLIAALVIVSTVVVSWKLGAGVAVGLVFIASMGLWESSMETLALVFVATALCVAVGLPIGIAMARRDNVNTSVRPLLDFMQTIPSLVLLVPAVAAFGLGRVPALVATLIYAMPPIIRLSNLGIRGVPKETTEAGRAFGATERQMLWKIQLPLGFPSIMMGVNQVIMMALAMVVLGGFIGAPGLGEDVARALGRLDTGRALAAGLAIVVLAIIVDRLVEGIANRRERKRGSGAVADEHIPDQPRDERTEAVDAVTPDDAEGEPVIVLRELSKIFGPRPEQAQELLDEDVSKQDILQRTRSTVAVQNVSFDINAGETFVIMGLSGSGKSTLVRLLNRLIEPTSGQVEVGGRDVTTLKRDELTELRREKFGMVFQRFALLPHRTVLENVAFGLEIQGVAKAERRERAGEVLELVGLGGWGESRPDELSGGMQQRVGLARALASDPDILLMDEPFSALDPLMRRQMQEEMIDLQARLRKTIVFITHDLDEALRLGDRIAIMKDGEIIQLGTPEDIMLRPADDYVASFVEGHDRSEVLTARDVMLPPPEVVRSGHSPSVALRSLDRAGLSRVLVVGPANRLVGSVTADALEAASRSGKEQVRDLELDEVPTAGPDESVRTLIAQAAVNDQPIAVVEGDRLLGVVGRGAILRGLSEALDELAVDGDPDLVSESAGPVTTG
jgi:glycine betaine/proline transport system ATP-binding protein